MVTKCHKGSGHTHTHHASERPGLLNVNWWCLSLVAGSSSWFTPLGTVFFINLSHYYLYISAFTIHTLIYSTIDMCGISWLIHLSLSFSLISLLSLLLKTLLQRYMKLKMDTYRFRYLCVVVCVPVSLYCLSVYSIV